MDDELAFKISEVSQTLESLPHIAQEHLNGLAENYCETENKIRSVYYEHEQLRKELQAKSDEAARILREYELEFYEVEQKLVRQIAESKIIEPLVEKRIKENEEVSPPNIEHLVAEKAALSLEIKKLRNAILLQIHISQIKWTFDENQKISGIALNNNSPVPIENLSNSNDTFKARNYLWKLLDSK